VKYRHINRRCEDCHRPGAPVEPRRRRVPAVEAESAALRKLRSSTRRRGQSLAPRGGRPLRKSRRALNKALPAQRAPAASAEATAECAADIETSGFIAANVSVEPQPEIEVVVNAKVGRHQPDKAMHKQSISVRQVAIAAITAAAFLLPIMSVAGATEETPAAVKPMNHHYHHAAVHKRLYNSAVRPSAAQGGTTGGTVYPGVHSNHHQHGYNGG
jgi:hypothetical protein